MNLVQIQKEYEKDIALHNDNLDRKIYEMPVLHSKYLRYYTMAKKKHDTLLLEMNKLHRLKWHFYSHEYGFKLKNQKEILIYVEGDVDIIEKKSELYAANRMLEHLKSMLTKVEKLSFEIKNILEYNKWIGGG